VGALVVADLAEQVGQAPVLAVLRRVAAGVGLGLQLAARLNMISAIAT
jgi:hypothetical protein